MKVLAITIQRRNICKTNINTKYFFPFPAIYHFSFLSLPRFFNDKNHDRQSLFYRIFFDAVGCFTGGQRCCGVCS
jgi:hypothetical protein